MEITFLNHRDLDHYEKLHPRLKEVLKWVHEFLGGRYDKLTYTSIYRHLADEKAKGRSGVHGLHRAADIVLPNFQWRDYAPLTLLINDIFDYGDGGKHQVAFADPHGTGPHLHLQARDGTQKRLIKET